MINISFSDFIVIKGYFYIILKRPSYRKTISLMGSLLPQVNSIRGKDYLILMVKFKGNDLGDITFGMI